MRREAWDGRRETGDRRQETRDVWRESLQPLKMSRIPDIFLSRHPTTSHLKIPDTALRVRFLPLRQERGDALTRIVMQVPTSQLWMLESRSLRSALLNHLANLTNSTSSKWLRTVQIIPRCLKDSPLSKLTPHCPNGYMLIKWLRAVQMTPRCPNDNVRIRRCRDRAGFDSLMSRTAPSLN